MYREIIHYYRQGHKRPRGCVIGIIDGDRIAVGYSLYHRKIEQKNGVPFSKKRAVAIARGRAKKLMENDKDFPTRYPHTLWIMMGKIYQLCRKLKEENHVPR